jgi:DNA-binding TFAR19-related protein (PDSD5 family)
MDDASTGYDQYQDRTQLQQKKLEALLKAQQQEALIKRAMIRLLDQAAYDRLINVRIANPDMYVKAVNAIIYNAQRLKRKLTDAELRSILSSLAERREPEITIQRK